MAGVDFYDRQQALGLEVPTSAIVAGCGGVGSWVATFLALSGVRRLYLYDPDSLEASNLNRLPLSPGQCGRPKALALKEWLLGLRPEAIIIAAQTVADEVVMVKADVFFDCTDDYRVREPLYRWCQENSVRYIRAGYDGGHHLTVTDTLPWEVGIPLGRYEVVPSYIIPAVMTAALAVHSILTRNVRNGTISTSLDNLYNALRLYEGGHDELP